MKRGAVEPGTLRMPTTVAGQAGKVNDAVEVHPPGTSLPRTCAGKAQSKD